MQFTLRIKGLETGSSFRFFLDFSNPIEPVNKLSLCFLAYNHVLIVLHSWNDFSESRKQFSQMCIFLIRMDSWTFPSYLYKDFFEKLELVQFLVLSTLLFNNIQIYTIKVVKLFFTWIQHWKKGDSLIAFWDAERGDCKCFSSIK